MILLQYCSCYNSRDNLLIYASNHIGAISNMVDPRVSAEGLKDYINEVNSKVVVCISDAYNKISSIINKTCVEKVIVISPSDSLKGIKKVCIR